MKKGSKLYSILKFKCPHCQEGDFFKSNNPYTLREAGNIHEKCPACNAKNTKEPGFYYGAMYISYALAVGVFVSIFLVIYLLHKEATFTTYITCISAGIVIASPLLYALSKIIWANIFFTYKQNGRS